MRLEELIEVFEGSANRDNAIKQEAYLKNQFKFLGIAKPERAKLEKLFVKETTKLDKQEVIDLVFKLSNL